MVCVLFAGLSVVVSLSDFVAFVGYCGCCGAVWLVYCVGWFPGGFGSCGFSGAILVVGVCVVLVFCGMVVMVRFGWVFLWFSVWG